MKLTDILRQIIQEKKSKRDRCLRIADRKFNKPSAYKSGAVVRCRQGKIWKGLKEEKEQNIQDLAYQQTPGLLEKGIEDELNFLSDIMDETLEGVKQQTNPQIKRVPLSSIKPSQFGEDYKNPSSEYEAKEFQKILDGSKDVADHREEDFHPIMVNRLTNKIVDGNHRHYALSTINSPYAVVLYVDVPREYLNESKQVGPLYHFTDFFSLKKILTSNTMIGSYGNQDIKGRYISTTRDKNFYKSDPNLGVENLQVALIFDGNKLSNKYKIKPYAYEPYRDLDRSGAEAEELIILPGRDLPNIKSYLSGVILLKPNKAIESFLKKENIPYNVDLSEAKKETLRTWFKRKGAPGKTGGWVDCNSPIRKDGKITGYKPCGRQKGEERAKYPSCRPTAARCKDKGKGTKWGKTK